MISTIPRAFYISFLNVEVSRFRAIHVCTPCVRIINVTIEIGSENGFSDSSFPARSYVGPTSLSLLGTREYICKSRFECMRFGADIGDCNVRDVISMNEHIIGIGSESVTY